MSLKPFQAEQILWEYTDSKEKNADRQPDRTRTSLHSAFVTCPDCGHQWTAFEGELRTVIGGVFTRCPACDHTANLTWTD